VPGILLAIFAVAYRGLIEPFVWVIVALWLAASVLALALSAWHVLGRELVSVEDGSLVATRSIGRWSREQAVPLSSIREVNVLQPGPEARLNDLWGFGLPRVAVVAAGMTMRVALAASPGEANELANALRAAATSHKQE
jgi:hypothetical protein